MKHESSSVHLRSLKQAKGTYRGNYWDFISPTYCSKYRLWRLAMFVWCSLLFRFFQLLFTFPLFLFLSVCFGLFPWCLLGGQQRRWALQSSPRSSASASPTSRPQPRVKILAPRCMASRNINKVQRWTETIRKYQKLKHVKLWKRLTKRNWKLINFLEYKLRRQLVTLWYLTQTTCSVIVHCRRTGPGGCPGSGPSALSGWWYCSYLWPQGC